MSFETGGLSQTLHSHGRPELIPSNYVSFFQTASQAAGALIGLLIVVVALKPAQIVGADADPVARRLAASSFTGLVDAFFLSLLALIPGHNLGVGAAIIASLSLSHTLALHLGHRGQRIRGIPRRMNVIFVASVLAYGVQLYFGVAFALHPQNADLVKDLSFVLIVAFAVALSRAWQLLQSAAVSNGGASQAAGKLRSSIEP